MQKTSAISASGESSQASTHDFSRGFLSLVLHRFANWRRRRQVGRIEQLDDHILEDIGVTRSDVVWARGLGLDRNPMVALQRVAHQHRLARLNRQRIEASISKLL